MRGKVPKKKVEIGEVEARYLREGGDWEVEVKVPKKKVEIGEVERASDLRRRWKVGEVRAKVPKKKVELGRWRDAETAGAGER